MISAAINSNASDDDDDDAKADDGGGVKLQSEWSCPRLANRLQRSSFRPFGITLDTKKT